MQAAAKFALTTPEEIGRFWAKVVVDCASDCWVWTGARLKGPGGGYGQLTLRQKQVRAHRVAYATWRGGGVAPPLLDHVVCDFRACVNPWHVEPSTNKANVLRGKSFAAENAAKTRCLRGHELSANNVRVFRQGKHTSRQCRPCERLRKNERNRLARKNHEPSL